MPAVDINDSPLRQACAEATLEVLETMLFEFPVDEPGLSGPPPAGDAIATAVFDGSLAGSLTVAISAECTARLAAGFLGLDEDEAGESEQRSLVIELANVICGATMSRLEPEGRLRIQPPVFGPRAEPDTGDWLHFPIEGGHLAVSAYYQQS